MKIPGTLYLCATPIGNLEDMTYRAVNVLRDADLIAAEDTRHTRKLLSHFDIHTPLISYHEHNKQKSGPLIVERLLEGQNIALVSDAGMPGISDPGQDLVNLAINHNINVIPIPGANAALSGLICSGLDTTMFTFIGFLPKTQQKRRDLLKALVNLPYTLIFYESPHRLLETIREIREFLGDRDMAAARELTKKYEEFVRGKTTYIENHFMLHKPRGEFTLIVSGSQKAEETAIGTDEEPEMVVQAVFKLMEAGLDKKEAIRKIAVERNVSRRDVYQTVLKAEKKEEA